MMTKTDQSKLIPDKKYFLENEIASKIFSVNSLSHHPFLGNIFLDSSIGVELRKKTFFIALIPLSQFNPGNIE